MSSLIIACRTISDELNLAMEQVGCDYPVLWIESGLHLNPELLKKRLQEELDHISNVKRVFMAFGFCGNALLDLKPPSYQMIFPRVDDCITLLLGSAEKRKQVSGEMGTYFLTKGWLEYETNIWSEYQATIKRLGQEKADRMYKILLSHYRRLGIIETGAFDMAQFLARSKEIARHLKLEHQVIPGTLDYLRKLLTGPWDEDFIVINPGETVTLKHLLSLAG